MKEIELGWQLIEGKLPILLVASHNFPHYRKGELIPRDLWTGNIVRKLCDKYNCYGIVSTRIIKDPNWYKNSSFRKEVKKIIETRKIKVVLDLHGRKLSNFNLVEFFPNELFIKVYGELLKQRIIKKFSKNEQVTLCEDLDDEGIAGVEIEIREDGRVPTVSPENYQIVINNLSDFIQSTNNFIQKQGFI
jgi:hypothetical protein